MKARERIRQIVERWFLTEPLLFNAWNTHRIVVEPRIRNIRVMHGRIEYNPAFIEALDPHQQEAVMRFEALRILLKHPYARRKEALELSYEASNLALQESLRSELPIPTARQRFGSDEYDKQYFEFYYEKLLSEQEQIASQQLNQLMEPKRPQAHGADSSQMDQSSGGDDESEAQKEGAGDGTSSSKVDAGGTNRSPSAAEAYADPEISGVENSADWEPDDLLVERIDSVIREAHESGRWGSVAGGVRDQILATLRPSLDYRAVLRQFRTSIISTRRSLTRMRPNRRYGFDYLGSRREYTTRLLVAVDVSGSMSEEDLRRGFSMINRFFKYGIQQIDVIQFDAKIIDNQPMSLKRAKHAIEIRGRGGTCFSPVMSYIDEYRDYDGLIIFTDGMAPTPDPPKNRRTKLLWIFIHEQDYRSNYPHLKHLGKGAFVRKDQRTPY